MVLDRLRAPPQASLRAFVRISHAFQTGTAYHATQVDTLVINKHIGSAGQHRSLGYASEAHAPSRPVVRENCSWDAWGLAGQRYGTDQAAETLNVPRCVVDLRLSMDLQSAVRVTT